MIKETIFLFLIFSSLFSYSQNVGIGTTTPDSSAALEIKSSSQGFLPPRMTTAQRNAIANPAEGLQIFNTTTKCLQIYAYGYWQNIYCAQPATQTNTSGVTDIDGNTYDTIRICNQTWTAKNLNVSHYRNGDIIPQVTDPAQWASLTTGAWCWYNNDSATYGATYGKLYNWYAVNDPRGLAPEGWHVPSEYDWNLLFKCLDANTDTASNCSACWISQIAGGKLKETGFQHWTTPNTGATNDFGYSGIPGGSRYDNGEFHDIGLINQLWSNLPDFQNDAWYHSLIQWGPAIFQGKVSKKYGFSVRCIKDTIPTTLTNGLVAYYPFNGNANDESGNGNNGTVNGATLTTDRFGNGGNAYSFNGINTNIIVPHASSLNLTSYSVCAWVKFSSFSQAHNEIFTKGGDIDENYEILVYGDYFGRGLEGPSMVCTDGNRMPNPLFYPSYNPIATIANSTLNPNQWYFIVHTYNLSDGSGQSFINGVLSMEYNSGGRTPKFNNTPLYIGQDPYVGRNCLGIIDDIRIYNRALTQEEITYLATH